MDLDFASVHKNAKKKKNEANIQPFWSIKDLLEQSGQSRACKMKRSLWNPRCKVSAGAKDERSIWPTRVANHNTGFAFFARLEPAWRFSFAHASAPFVDAAWLPSSYATKLPAVIVVISSDLGKAFSFRPPILTPLAMLIWVSAPKS